MRTRVWALGSAVLTVAAGLTVRAVPGGAVGEAAGDALYTVFAYTLLVAAAPRARPARVAGLAAAFSWVVEFFQLTGVPESLTQHWAMARLVFGSTFSPPDLAWYCAGAAAAGFAHAACRRQARRVPRPTGPAASP